MIYDCFSFYNEKELLEIRLFELCDRVDYFVLVEATKTHSGLEKELFYDKWKSEWPISLFQKQIIHVIVDDMPITPEEIQNSLSSNDKKWIESKYQIEDNWVRERHQRNCMMDGLQNCDPEDIIIISDADEIVRRNVVTSIKSDYVEGSNAVEQQLNSFYLNVVCNNMEWYGSKIIKRKYLENDTPSEVRFHTPASRYINHGGWHYAWLGGADRIKNKINSYAHQEFNVPSVLENVDNQLSNLKDVLGRLYQYDVIEMDSDNTPRYVLTNLDRFQNLIYKG
jgi:beta-1,4-mannosyl-glycoprotein beta-1,4-N-acetylglucosaminyltransferase